MAGAPARAEGSLDGFEPNAGLGNIRNMEKSGISTHTGAHFIGSKHTSGFPNYLCWDFARDYTRGSAAPPGSTH